MEKRRNHSWQQGKSNPAINMKSSLPKIAAFLDDTICLLRQLDQSAIESVKNILLDCYRRNGRIYTVGNGGSASTAQHFACDLAKYVIPNGQRPFDVRCLTDNVSLYTAWANDAEREDVFVNQMRGLLTADDVVLAISVHGGSGFSADLVRTVRFGNQTGAKTIALVGFDGGILHREATCSILVPVQSTPQTEAIHLVIEHLLMSLIKEELATK
jgi:D-sedoheptulose 7-phosphate isomerase